MKQFLFSIILLFTSLKLSAQISKDFSCDDFTFNIESNTRNSVEFLNKERYFQFIKDSIPKSKKPVIAENKKLNEEFQKKFPNTITEHCIHAKSFSQGKIEDTSFCNNKYNISLISKEYNFYIFKILAFEIDNYLIFNTNNKTIYSSNHYPIILNNGKFIFDIGYSYDGLNSFNYFKFKDNNVGYFELSIPLHYQIKNYNIINAFNGLKLTAELTKYNVKETSPNKSEDDKSDFCTKFINIPVSNDRN
ncbi:hypothetical protein [Chryseobacterium polytrichastri]|uniref:GLPGLI family protein n=1 Tax=Chryseobacterium polytrichastri TaxID=1302687 RepID=A0A1M6Z2D0_9FLAO|nr:hypothetical protein [Chryseobacterium polytrichastri]SHL24550.1 hypothetical protein SAMN05444267_101488 [Chryseobacterium polytrichastri]